MFTIHRTYNSYDLPVATLYIDSLYREYSFENINIHATKAESTLDVSGVQASCVFNGDGFPLQGSDYLTAVTGTLTIAVMEALAMGLHFFPFVATRDVYPVMGLMVHGIGVMGVKGTLYFPIGVQLQVQHFEIPGVALPTQGSAGIPTVEL